jgi:hypothetical protein
MSYPINYPTPQNADVQIFSRGGSISNWVKPQGCSFVYFLLIGAGANGAPSTSAGSVGGGGGGTGAVTRCLMPAFLIPDVLRVFVGEGGGGSGASNRTRVEYQLKATTAYLLFEASSSQNATTSSGATGATNFTGNYFTAVGFFNSTQGTNGAAAGANATLSGITFLGGGGGGGNALGADGGTSPAQYNYPTLAGGTGGASPTNGRDGISILSNLIVGQGGSGGGAAQNLPTAVGADGGNGGIGSGGGGGGIGSSSGNSSGGKGGNGLAVIISW